MKQEPITLPAHLLPFMSAVVSLGAAMRIHPEDFVLVMASLALTGDQAIGEEMEKARAN